MSLNIFIFRTRIISVGLFFFAFVLITKLFFVQVINGGSYSEKADNQYVAPSSNIFNRGTIFFKEKNGNLVSAATLKSGYILAIDPSNIIDVEKAFQEINKIWPIDKDSFFAKASKTDDPYEEIDRRLSYEIGEKIRNLEIEGVGVYTDRWRFYPALNSSSHTLGFVGYKGDNLVGRYGLEQYYNETLERKDKNLYVNFFAEIFSNVSQTIFKGDESREGDIVLSVEPLVQSFLDSELKKLTEKWDSNRTGGIIINPKTGDIYAMGAIPSFDPNTFNEESDASIFSNPLIEHVFEMGSIIKPLTISFGLDSGAINIDTEYYDYGFVELNGARIENYDGKGRGRVEIQEILSQSLNTGAVFVMREMGKDVFREYMYSLEIGEETGIDLPNEAVGLVSNLNSIRDIEYATASFGQGIAMTPMATARALSILGNGGYLITPHLVEKIDYTIGLSKDVIYNKGPQIITPETSEEITRMLVRVVDEALLGGSVALDRYSIAAKTGTAQIADVVNGGYYDDRSLHSFFGYFPAYDPEFLVFLYTIYPKEVKYASNTLTEPFMNITKFLLNYYDIPPDR